MPRSCRARAHDAAQAPATAAPDLLSLLAAEDEKKLPPDDGLMAGLDEAGRGCLAGPVVAAAVILPPLFDLPGLTDSKACTARTRERLAPRIRQCATAWGLGVVWPARIDRINILQATFEAMCRAVRCLRHPPALLCIDGNHTLPSALLAAHWVRGHGAHAPLPRQQALVRGDARVPAIPPHPFWPKPTGTPSWRTWTAAGRATVLPRTKATAPRSIWRPCAAWAPAPSTG